VLLIATRFGPQFTGKPLSTPALGGNAVAREVAGSSGVLFKVIDEGDVTLHTDHNSDALRADGNNDVPSGDDDVIVLIIGVIGAGNILSVCDVLVSIYANDAIGAISGGSSHDVGALGTGGDGSILSACDLSMGGSALAATTMSWPWGKATVFWPRAVAVAWIVLRSTTSCAARACPPSS
jgi:hypothetical protein